MLKHSTYINIVVLFKTCKIKVKILQFMNKTNTEMFRILNIFVIYSDLFNKNIQ